MAKCLIVDDSRVIRKLATRMMSTLDIETSEAENGAEAFESCAAAMPDVVLLDWNMPVMNGLEFLKKLRASDLTPQPKVLFCTSETEFARIAEAISAGADEYIMKPFDEEILTSKLKMIGVL